MSPALGFPAMSDAIMADAASTHGRVGVFYGVPVHVRGTFNNKITTHDVVTILTKEKGQLAGQIRMPL